MAVNYDDVLEQLQSFGLIVQHLELGRLRRCKVVDSNQESRGWYALHEITSDTGDSLIVGSYGIWHGAENNAQKVRLDKANKLTREQSEALKDRIAQDKRRARAQRQAAAEKASLKASGVWKKSLTEGDSEYLARKGIQPYGVRYTESGSIVIPMLDTTGTVHGIQFILPSDHPHKKKTGRDKTFWPAGLSMKGCFFQIGGTPRDILLIAEGYATAATLHEATGFPVAVAFNANNLLPVCQALKKRYQSVNFLVCGDDDYLTEGNPGVTCANAAALAVSGSWIVPTFTEDRAGKKFTDFNDLHKLEGLHQVRHLLDQKVLDLKWRKKPAGSAQAGGEGVTKDDILKPIQTYDELHDRFSLIYGHRQTVFDHQERILLGLADMRDACTSREIHRRWMDSPEKKLVRIDQVGFDPAEQDKKIRCNLWGGWPTTPKKGTCDELLQLLEYLCSGEENMKEVSEWVLKWLAYPIQNPGAKMQTALVFHGPQGVGKNLLFEVVMAIYGEYGRIVDQAAIEDKFNDWASKKLFLIADEVVARAELFHTKNKLKSFITSDWIRINPKNVTAYEERNHCNLVFLSNETQPLVLERDDRRYTVIWTPKKLDPEVYLFVKKEIDNGGIEALHDYLKNLELGDFQPWTKPPMTKAKEELIDLGMDSTERFWNSWIKGLIDGMPVCPVKSEDLFQFYRMWCSRMGFARFAPMPRLIAEVSKRTGAIKKQARYHSGQSQKMATFIFPPGVEQPEDLSKTLWVTKSVDMFTQAFESWKSD